MKIFKFKVWVNVARLYYKIKAVNKQSAYCKLQRKLVKRPWFKRGLMIDTAIPKFDIRTINIQFMY